MTLTLGATPLALPADLQWVDEFDWAPVTQRTEYTITGALVVEAAQRQAGRQITLRGGADYAWVTRATLDQLRTWAAQPGAQFGLLLRGATRTVAFDHDRGALEASPVVDYAEPAAGDFYAVTLRFIET